MGRDWNGFFFNRVEGGVGCRKEKGLILGGGFYSPSQEGWVTRVYSPCRVIREKLNHNERNPGVTKTSINTRGPIHVILR